MGTAVDHDTVQNRCLTPRVRIPPSLELSLGWHALAEGSNACMYVAARRL